MIPLERHWLERVATRGGIITCRELADWVEDPALGRYQPWGALRLLADVGNRLRCYLDYFTALPAEMLSRIERRALDLLRNAREPVAFDPLLANLRTEFGPYDGSSDRILTVVLEHHPAINGTRDGRYFLTQEAAAWFVADILKDAGSSVSLDTLRQRYNEQMLPHSQKSAQALVHVIGKLPPVSRVGAALYRWRKED
jgi:hypothetical protein